MTPWNKDTYLTPSEHVLFIHLLTVTDLTNDDLGYMISRSPRTVSRLLSSLQRKGMIAIEGYGRSRVIKRIT